MNPHGIYYLHEFGEWTAARIHDGELVERYHHDYMHTFISGPGNPLADLSYGAGDQMIGYIPSDDDDGIPSEEAELVVAIVLDDADPDLVTVTRERCTARKPNLASVWGECERPQAWESDEERANAATGDHLHGQLELFGEFYARIWHDEQAKWLKLGRRCYSE